jgi:hypothetical protein
MVSCPITAVVAFLTPGHLEEEEEKGDPAREKTTAADMDPPSSTSTHLEEALTWGKHTPNWWRIYHLVALCAKLMLEVASHLPDQT